MKIPHLKLIERDDWLVQCCRGRSVLHVGCTDWPITQTRIEGNSLLHQKICEVAKEAVGVDIDKEGIEQLSRLIPNNPLVVWDVEKLEECPALIGKRFDIVLAADVLEHLSNVGSFLRGACKIIQPAGRLLITTPNAFSIKRFLALILGQEHVHPDHVSYFSVSTLTRLLARYALTIETIYGFQWRNPSLRNSIANVLVFSIVSFSMGRLCDELALLVKVTGNNP